MNIEKLKEAWNNLKSELFKKVSVLTKDHIFFRVGRKGEMVEGLQLISLKNKEQLIMIFDEIRPQR